MKRCSFLAAALALAFCCAPAMAQSAPPSPPPFSVLCYQTTLAVTDASANTPFYPVPSCNALTLINEGTADVYFATGDSSVTASAGGGCLAQNGTYQGGCDIPPGQRITIWLGTGTYIAAVTASDTSNFAIYEATGPV
jgi:hypothetical protein